MVVTVPVLGKCVTAVIFLWGCGHRSFNGGHSAHEGTMCDREKIKRQAAVTEEDYVVMMPTKGQCVTM